MVLHTVRYLTVSCRTSKTEYGCMYSKYLQCLLEVKRVFRASTTCYSAQLHTGCLRTNEQTNVNSTTDHWLRYPTDALSQQWRIYSVYSRSAATGPEFIIERYKC